MGVRVGRDDHIIMHFLTNYNTCYSPILARPVVVMAFPPTHRLLRAGQPRPIARRQLSVNQST